jgi:hypothetical protein
MTTTSDLPFPIPLAQALAPVRDLYLPLVEEAVAWQADRRRHTEADHYVLLCLGADRAYDATTTPTRWTRTTAYHVLRCDVPSWCSLQGCRCPAELPEAMWDWFDFLDATGRLDPSGDPLAELRKPLLCYGGLDQRGRRLADGAARTVECECFLPYRETAELLNELGRRCEWSGVDPLDALRGLLGHPPRRHHGAAFLDDALPPDGLGWFGSPN